MKDISGFVPAPPPKWVVGFARIGLFAKGVVYCLVGLLAFMAAFEIGGRPDPAADQQGAFQFVKDQPFGKPVLLAIGVGLSFYALWRIIQALKDTENKGNDLEGMARRVGYLFSGVVYGALAVAAFRLDLGAGPDSEGDKRQTLAREVLQQPMGQWLLGLVGVGVIISGLYQVYRGLSEKYRKETAGAHLKHKTAEMVVRAGKIGYVARGIVWGVIGYFFIQAAIHTNPSAAGGTGEAFQFLEGRFGSALLGAVALGLVCYGGFMFVRAWYQPVHTA